LVWLFIALSFVSRFSLLSLMHHEARFYSSFMPALLVLAVGGVVVLLRALPGVLGHPLLRVAGASAVVAFALGPKLSTLEFRANGLGALPAPFDAVAELTPPRSVVAARGPRVAWYGDRPTLRLSGDLSSLETVDEELVRIDAVLLPDEARAFHADLASRPDLGFRVAAQAERQTLWVKQVEELRP
jgi:hypothetical protein